MFKMLITSIFSFVLFVPSFSFSEDRAIDKGDPLLKAFVCKSAIKDIEGAELLDRTQSSYKEVRTLKAEFKQFSKVLGMTEDIPSSGGVSFKKPGKMDWNYKTPDEQRFVTDGETVWFYEPKVNQVTIGQLNKSFSSDLPVSFLLGIGEISKSFKLVKSCVTGLGYLFELTPISATSSFKTFFLLVNRDKFIPIGAKILDQGDTLTQFIFEDLITNEDIVDRNFYFEPPKGVDIVYNN